MSAANPYQAPAAPVATPEQYSKVKIFSVAGRLGRMRYIAYSIGYSMLIAIAFGGAGGLLSAAAPHARTPLVLLGNLLSMAFIIMLTIQRAHDFNTTGWLAILAIIPLVNFLFWFIPGSPGENRFGHRTPPNGTGVVVAALIVPFVAVAGIIAAIAIPAYQQYEHRAQAARMR